MSASWWWQSRKLMFLPSLHNKKRKRKDCACSKIKIEPFYLRERWWTWNEGRSPAQLLYILDALQTKWWKLEFCSLRAFPSIVSLSNLIFPMNDTFRISDGTTTQRVQKRQTHNCHSDSHPAATHHQGKKRKKKVKGWKWNPLPKSNADEEEKLLAFSYLFVPLLFLGMKGEKKRERQQRTGYWRVDCEVLDS